MRFNKGGNMLLKIREKLKTKQLAIITDIVLFLGVVFIFILLLKQLDLPSYNEYEEVMAQFNSGNFASIEEENEVYIKKIKNDYGINIEYGKSTEDYADSVNAEIQEDETIINHNLKQIYETLGEYPDQVFDIFRSKKYPMNIILVNRFRNNTLALASKNNLNQYRLFVSNTSKYERAFHHEMFHVLEYYMEDKKKNLYSNWAELNPEGFSYQPTTSLLNNDYVFSTATNSTNQTNPYFVTKYSKASDKEDRAEIFAELMIAESKASYLQEGQHIREKAEVIDQSIQENITMEPFQYHDLLYSEE